MAAATADAVPVWLGEGIDSGFAHIMAQFLLQNLEESAKKRRKATRLRGRVAMTAVDHDCTVTFVFAEDGVAILDGEQGPLDASIAGPYETMLALAQGKTNPLTEHIRGRIKVTSSVRRPFLPLHVQNLLKLEEESARRPVSGIVLAAAVALAGAGALAAAAWLLA